MTHNNSLKYLFVFNSIFVIAANAVGPLYALYVATIDKSIFSISLSWSAFLISVIIFTLTVAKWGDSILEKEYLLMSGFTLRAVSWILFIFATNLTHLILIQIILGIGEALGGPAFDAIVAKHLDDGKQIREYSHLKIITYIAMTIGTLLGGFIVSKFGFNYLFLLMSFLAIISFVGIYRLPRKLL